MIPKQKRLIQEEIWKNRKETDHYWSSHLPRREWFAEEIIKMKVGSVYEVGCNNAKNLWCIKQIDKKNRIKVFGGLDVNTSAIKRARKEMPQGRFVDYSIYRLCSRDKYDVVFTSGVLLHIPSDQVKNIIKKMIQKASKWVILMETPGPDSVENGPEELNPTKKIKPKIKIFHDYERIFRELGYDDVEITVLGFGDRDSNRMIKVSVG